MADVPFEFVAIGVVAAVVGGAVVAAPGAVPVDLSDIELGNSESSNEEEVAESTITETAKNTPTTVTTTTASNEITAYRAAIQESINDRRSDEGKTRLSQDDNLEDAAQMHADAMAERGFFSHTWPDGTEMQDRLRQHNVGCPGAENIYRTTRARADPDDLAREVTEGWINSEGHRKNLLGSHQSTGIGVARGTIEGKRNVFVVQVYC